jgi:hypothetical protein
MIIMINLGMVKTAVGFVIGIGVEAIVDNGIKAITPSNMKGYKKACVWLAGLAISGMVAKGAIKYGEDTIDSAFNGVKKMVEAENQEEVKEEKQEAEV